MIFLQSRVKQPLSFPSEFFNRIRWIMKLLARYGTSLSTWIKTLSKDIVCFAPVTRMYYMIKRMWRTKEMTINQLWIQNNLLLQKFTLRMNLIVSLIRIVIYFHCLYYLFLLKLTRKLIFYYFTNETLIRWLNSY